MVCGLQCTVLWSTFASDQDRRRETGDRRRDLQTLWDGNRRQGADLLSMRERDDGATHQAAGGRTALRAAPPFAPARRHRRGDCARDPNRVGT